MRLSKYLFGERSDSLAGWYGGRRVVFGRGRRVNAQ